MSLSDDQPRYRVFVSNRSMQGLHESWSLVSAAVLLADNGVTNPVSILETLEVGARRRIGSITVERFH